MKSSFLLLLIFPILESKYFHRINKVECGASMKTIAEYRCFLKSYDRKYPTINGGFRFLREVPNGKLNFDHYRQDSADQSYKHILHFQDIEVCKIIKEGSANTFFAMMLNLVRTFEGNILNLCHSKEYLKASNISFVNTTMARMFPAGEHKTSLKFFDDIDDKIGYVTFYSTIRE